MPMKSEDYILIEKKDYYGLWVKYRELIAKFYNKLAMHKIYAFDDFQDFYQSCYEVLVEAADKIKLEKVKKEDTWTFYIQLYHYLQNYTSRKVVKDYYNNINMLPYDSEILDESSYIDDNSSFEKTESLKQTIPHLSEHDKKLLTKYIESGGVRSQAREAVLKKIRELSK